MFFRRIKIKKLRGNEYFLRLYGNISSAAPSCYNDLRASCADLPDTDHKMLSYVRLNTNIQRHNVGKIAIIDDGAECRKFARYFFIIGV